MLVGVSVVAILLASTARRVFGAPGRLRAGGSEDRGHDGYGYGCGRGQPDLAAHGDRLQPGAGDGVYVNLTLPANVTVTYTYTDRGTGCTSTGATTWHCYLDWLADTAQVGHVILTAKVTATGDHALTAVAGYNAPDPTPNDNTVTLTATTPGAPVAPVAPVAVTAVVAAGVGTPSNQTAGKLGAGHVRRDAERHRRADDRRHGDLQRVGRRQGDRPPADLHEWGRPGLVRHPGEDEGQDLDRQGDGQGDRRHIDVEGLHLRRPLTNGSS